MMRFRWSCIRLDHPESRSTVAESLLRRAASSPPLTNFLPAKAIYGVPVYPLSIIETQDISRFWYYCDSANLPFRTNPVPFSFDAQAWVRTAYRHAPPCYLDDLERTQWYSDRDRSRVSLTMALISEKDLPLFHTLQLAAMTNAPMVGGAAAGPSLPIDTNRLAFAGVQSADTQTGLWLYTPASRPVALFTRIDLTGPSAGWKYAGNLGAVPPFNLWPCNLNLTNTFFHMGFSDVDADGDGLPDVIETLSLGTNPRRYDSAGGKLGDYVRILVYNLNPLAISTAGDGIPDEWKIAHGINPHDPAGASQDADGDGPTNLQEYQLGTDPANAVSLSANTPSISGNVTYTGSLTGIIYVVAVTTSNSWAMDHSYCMVAPGAYLIRDLPASNYWIKAFRDVNGNGVRETWEPMGFAAGGARAISGRVSGIAITLDEPDSDGDGLSDYAELFLYFTNPNNPDMDSDGLSDREELLIYQTSPFVNDTDQDELLDRDELFVRQTSPVLSYSDVDIMDDKIEVNTPGLSPTSHTDATGDLDGDGFDNETEYIDGWPMNSAASSTNLARYAFVYRWPGGNRLRYLADLSHRWCYILGDAGPTAAFVRIPPTKQISASATKYLFHSQTPGLFLNGVAMDSMASPISIPDSSGTMEYRVTASPAAQGSTAELRLGDASTNMFPFTLELHVPKISACRIQDGNANNYADVPYGQTNTLYVGWSPELPIPARVKLSPSYSNIGDIWPFINTEYSFASVSGTATNYHAHLDYRNYLSGLNANWYGQDRRGLPLPVGHHRVGVGFDFNLDQILQTSEESLSCEVYVVKIDLGIQRLNGDVVPEADEQTAGSIVQLTAKTNRAGLFLNLNGPTVEPADVLDQLTYKFLVTKPTYGGGAIRLYRNGVLYMDCNVTQKSVPSGDLNATWTVDATGGGVADLALVAYKPNGCEVTRDTVRINAIACTPADGNIRYVNPGSAVPCAPYTSLEHGAHTIGDALAWMQAEDNILITPAALAYQENGLTNPQAGVIAGLAGKWIQNDPTTNTTPLADFFDYSGLPDIQPGTTNGASIFLGTNNLNGTTALNLAGLRLRNGRAFQGSGEGGALCLANSSMPLKISCVKFDGNQSRCFGGAAAFRQVANATFDTCLLNNNLCEYDDGGIVCYTQGMGGAVAVFSSTVTVSNSVFNANIARVVYCGDRPTFGSAGGGGDIYLQRGNLRVNRSQSQYATAGFAIRALAFSPESGKTNFTGDGGSILVHGQTADTAVDIRDCIIKDAQSFGNGGAISFSKDCSPDARTFFVADWGANWNSPTIPVDPEPDALGGGCVGTISNVLFNGVKGGWQGGAISANGRGMDIVIRNCVFNTCQGGVTHLRDGKGGAVAVGGGLQNSGTPQNEVRVSRCELDSCSASGNGGGFYVTIRGKLSIEDTRLNSCKALNAAHSATNDCRMIAGHGGGIHASAGGYVNFLQQGTNSILNCNAAVNGGGLSVKSAKAYVLGSMTIQGNKAQGAFINGYGNGGGIFVSTSYYDEPDDEWRPSRLAGRLAARLYDDHGYLALMTMQGFHAVNIVSNHAARWGGGVYVGISDPWYGSNAPANYAESKVVLSLASIKCNTAGMLASISKKIPAQFAAEKVQDACSTPYWGGAIPGVPIPISGSPVLDLSGTQLDGATVTDIGVYLLDSIVPLSNGATTFGSLNPAYRVLQEVTP